MTRIRIHALDIALGFLLSGALAIFAVYLHTRIGGSIPRHNVYFQADCDRVVANLVDRNSNYLPLRVHPLFGLVCMVLQFALAHGLSLDLAFVLFAAIKGGMFAALLYTAMRVWGVSALLAGAAVLFGGASASFVYWAGIPETHFLGGLTTLVVIIAARHLSHDPVIRVLHSAAMFSIGFSMVVTDVMIWVLLQLQPAGGVVPPRGGVSRVRAYLQILPPAMAGALAGLGIVAIGSFVEQVYLKNPSMGQLLHVTGETKYLSLQDGSWLSLLNALGAIGPDHPAAWELNLLVAGLVAWSVGRGKPREAFIGRFALFGLALHSLYDRPHAFLFSGNYLPAAVVAIAIGFNRFRPVTGIVLLIVAAMPLGMVNIQGYQAKLATTQSDPLQVYERLRQPHAVPPGEVVVPADPPPRR